MTRTIRRKQWSRFVGSWKATKCSPRSRSSARRRTPPCRNISTRRKYRSFSPRPGRRASPIRRTFRGPSLIIRITRRRRISTRNTFSPITPTLRSPSFTRTTISGKTTEGAEGRARREGHHHDRRGGAVRTVGPDSRLANGETEIFRRRPLLQHYHAEVRRAGDQEGRRNWLEAGADTRHQRFAGRPDAGAGRPRKRQGHHLRQLREGPARSAMER